MSLNLVTLLYLIAGLEPASGGELLAFGEPVTGPSPERSLKGMRGRVGFATSVASATARHGAWR